MPKKPAHQFTPDAVRKFDGPADSPAGASDLNATARTIAAQLHRDTMSPVMVSGALRLVELPLLTTSGLALFAAYADIDGGPPWYYPIMIVMASGAAVMLLELTNCYQIPRLRQPITTLGTIVAVWIGTLALMALAGFYLKISVEFSRFWLGLWFVT